MAHFSRGKPFKKFHASNKSKDVYTCPTNKHHSYLLFSWLPSVLRMIAVHVFGLLVSLPSIFPGITYQMCKGNVLVSYVSRTQMMLPPRWKKPCSKPRLLRNELWIAVGSPSFLVPRKSSSRGEVVNFKSPK